MTTDVAGARWVWFRAAPWGRGLVKGAMGWYWGVPARRRISEGGSSAQWEYYH